MVVLMMSSVSHSCFPLTLLAVSIITHPGEILRFKAVWATDEAEGMIHTLKCVITGCREPSSAPSTSLARISGK